MITTTEKIHTFESAGLGTAPFRCVGHYSLPSPSLAEHNPTAYNNALAMMPKGFGCGACAYCGMPLVHNYLVRSADGEQFVVGSECVAKTGDLGLKDKAKTIKREIDRKAREEKREAARVSRLEVEKAANGGFLNHEWDEAHRENKKADIERESMKRAPLLAPLAERLRDGKGGFCDDIAAGLKRGELPRGRGLDITADILAKQCGRRNSKAYNAELDRVKEALKQGERT